MAKWIMPHEEQPVELVTPTKAEPRWVLPHEAEAEEAAVKTPAEVELAAETPLRRGLIGAGQTFKDVGLGAKQLAGMARNVFPGTPSTWPQEVSDVLKSEKETRAAIARDPYAVSGKAGANVALGLATPTTRVPAMAATGAVLGALTPQEQPSWGETVKEAGIGGVLGGLGGLATSGLTTTAAKAKNMAKGRFADPEYARRYRIFKENEIPASLGDITQNPTLMSMENAAQYIPGSGRKLFLERQAQRLQEVVSQAPEKIAGGVPSATKEDIGSTLVRSVKDKYSSVKKQASKMYDEVADAVKSAGAPPVAPLELQSRAAQLKADYPNVFNAFQDTRAVSRLDDIISGTGPKSSTILGPNGQPIKTAAAVDFEDMRWLDKRLGSMIRQGRQQMLQGKMDPEAFNQLAELQKALRRDIENWSSSIGRPDIEKGIKQANQYFRENVVPFRQSPLTRDIVMGKDVNIDTIANRMFKLDSPWLAEQSKSFLTPEGVQAGRYYLLSEAERKAMSDVIESGVKPGQFIKSSTMGETGPKLFSPDELGQIEDLQELVRASRRAGSYAADPSTGNRLLQLTPFVDWKIPLAAKAFSMTSQAERPVRYLLSDPRLYTGAGGLGRASEALLRKSGVGALENLPELTDVQE